MHFDFPVPFNSQLREANLVPYRSSKEVEEQIYYIFTHPFNKYNKLFKSTSTRHPYMIRELGNLAVGSVRHYLLNPQQYGNKLENIYMQVLVKLHRYFISSTKFIDDTAINQYSPLKLKILTIQTNLWDTILSDINNKNYIQSPDELVKKRKGVGLRERRVGYKEELLNYYDSLDYG